MVLLALVRQPCPHGYPIGTQLESLLLKQEIDGLLGQIAGVVLCGLKFQDKNSRTIEGGGWALHR